MTIWRLRLFLNFDKEESWLNQMAAEGRLLSKACVLYTFSALAPGSAAVVRVDYRSSMSRLDFADYVNLFEDSGWRHLHGSRHGGPQYFASFSADANTDIFSDANSRAQRYRRSIAAYGVLLPSFLVTVLAGWNPEYWFSPPRDWYFTPGLWDKHGADFIGAFLFESILVLPRVGAPFLFAAFCLYLLAVIVYQYTLFRKARISETPSSM
ncbi:DUF2812 domain-containing protein [Cryptosporangium aurantiacum]|uniref:DUF2812 domain-containing protein n=1 Tax=Cryptosporangium aurantiacum TaxID=134849 RepID=A0A1M7RF95_9ACTN|nr:DUF2812 domain-containing protein [Cryptosporangium aurantiacum]SHN44708.1 Protein of unknown function [Cryptosporangium aurantiacum]